MSCLQLSLASSSSSSRLGTWIGRGLAQLSSQPHPPCSRLVLLRGPLGSGKSTIGRSILKTLLPGSTDSDYPSPTFTLENRFAFERGHCFIRHLDLYRITSSPPPHNLLSASDQQLFDFPEALSRDICIVEWPDSLIDIRPSIVPPSHLLLDIFPVSERPEQRQSAIEIPSQYQQKAREEPFLDQGEDFASVIKISSSSTFWRSWVQEELLRSYRD